MDVEGNQDVDGRRHSPSTVIIRIVCDLNQYVIELSVNLFGLSCTSRDRYSYVLETRQLF